MKVPNITDGQAQIIIGLAALGVAIYAIYQVKSGIDAVGNGAKNAKDSVVNFVKDSNNPINGAAKSIVGEERLQGAFDTVFDFFRPDIKKQREAANSVIDKNKPAVKLSPLLTTAAMQPEKEFKFYQAGAK